MTDITKISNTELAKRLLECQLLKLGYDHDEVIQEAVFRLENLPNWTRLPEVQATLPLCADFTKNIAGMAYWRLLLRRYPVDSVWRIILRDQWGAKDYTIDDINKRTFVIRVRSIESGFVFPFNPAKHPHMRKGFK